MKYALCAATLLWLNSALAQAPAPSVVEATWTLHAAWDRVDQANRELASARRTLEMARADQLTATVTPAPQLSINSVAIDPHHLGGGGLWHRQADTIVRLDQLLERGDKARLRERGAQASVSAVQLDVQDVLLQQRVLVAQAYWDLKLAQAQWDIAVRNTALAQEGSRVAQVRLAQGDIARLDATRLAVEADRAANEQALARQHLVQASQALMRVLALESTSRPVMYRAVDDWLDRADGEDDDMGDEDWLIHRPDVQAAVARVEQARAQVDLAQAQRTTDVTVGLQFEHDPPAGNHLWGVGVSFPLGVSGRQDGAVAHALSAVAAAQEQLASVRAQALAERLDVRSAVLSARQRVDRLNQHVLPQAREALQAAEYARQQGAIALQDVLDARRTLHAVELDAVSAQADLAKALSVLTLNSKLNAVTL
jgi:cobalt-zinc-cadmium efflux system outer membrane protein